MTSSTAFNRTASIRKQRHSFRCPLKSEPDKRITVDLAAREVRADDAVWTFPIDDFSRWRLMEGLDDIGLTLRHEDAITAYERIRPAFKPVTV